jgi:uncharacterized membrane protein
MMSACRSALRQLGARPRLMIAIAVGLVVALLLPLGLATRTITRLIVGFNAGAWLYILLAGVMMARSTTEQMQRRAERQDDGRFAILILVILSAATSLASIIAELTIVKDLRGTGRYAHIGLAVLTIISSWVFTHLMFALHYAHDYYSARSRDLPGGLEFPGTDAPGYADFAYFSFIIGTSGQTADVSICSGPMRRVALVHCVLAFCFNTTLLALTINLAASLL